MFAAAKRPQVAAAYPVPRQIKLAPGGAGFKPLTRRGLGRRPRDWSYRGMSKPPKSPAQPVKSAPAAPAKPAGRSPQKPVEIGGPEGPEPTRYGDWERNGRCVDF